MAETARLPLQKTMSAAVIRGLRDVAVAELRVPEAGPGEVLVDASHCGICGSDLHYILEWGPMRPDALEGHEWSGAVVAVGPGVDRSRVGDTVVGGPIAGCGRCAPCQAGRPSLCAARGRVGLDAFQGAFARYKAHRADQMLEIPKGLSMRHAAPTEPLAVALHGITQAGGPALAGAGRRPRRGPPLARPRCLHRRAARPPHRRRGPHALPEPRPLRHVRGLRDRAR